MTKVNETGLSKFFGDYRAEWPHELFHSLFVKPKYYTRLANRRPCLLIGGRGTGKTTALKALRFDAVLARDLVKEGALPALGIYLRMNQNRVRAFQGRELTANEWGRAFAHYFNLLACHEMCSLVEWVGSLGFESAKNVKLDTVAASLGCNTPIASPTALRERIIVDIATLELYVNNPGQQTRPTLSIAEAPLRTFVDVLQRAEIISADRPLLCCIDEYENLTESQQTTINTYVKHSEPPLTYKIGLVKNGLKTRATSDEFSQITTPDDCDEIDVATEDFESFAREVVELRLRRARDAGLPVSAKLEDLLPDMPFSEEAERLGCEKHAVRVRHAIESSGDASLKAWAHEKADSELYFLSFWLDKIGSTDVLSTAQKWSEDPNELTTKLRNHGVASLFWLSRGRKGARTRKYYCGVQTFLLLASGNIRYFIELIDKTISVADRDETFLVTTTGESEAIRISGDAQTVAAKLVAEGRLSQIEGRGKHGGDLKRFALAVGRVFFEFARDPHKGPETNSFVLSGLLEDRLSVETILSEGVANLVFEASFETKMTNDAGMRNNEYRLHPIFCPFFEFSYRRKRKATFKASDFLLIRSEPRRAVASMLADTVPPDGEELPSQLAMFEDFYHGGSEHA